MITFLDGDIFKSGAGALVNPVNAVGVMGGGLALEFRHRFPENYLMYVKCCEIGILQAGGVFTYRENGIYILNAATKGHYKYPSQLKYVQDILMYIKDFLQTYNGAIAIPALGCGLGNLKWEEIKNEILLTLGTTPKLILVFNPREENDRLTR